MYIVTAKINNQVLGVSKEIQYSGVNGYPFLVDMNMSFPINQVNVYKVTKVPEGITPFEWTYDGMIFAQVEPEGPVEREEEQPMTPTPVDAETEETIPTEEVPEETEQ